MNLFKVYKKSIVMLVFSLLTLSTIAQDTTKSVKSMLTNDEELWYMQPWVWVVGGVALLLLLIALFSGKKKPASTNRTDKVIITKTIRTETDVDE